MSIFSFRDNNLGKYQWIFTKLGMCIDILAIWFGTTTRQTLIRVICLPQYNGGVLLFYLVFFLLFKGNGYKIVSLLNLATKSSGVTIFFF